MIFELIKIALGQKSSLSRIPSDNDWNDIFQFAVKQSLVGVLFSAVERLNAKDASVKPPMSLFYQWLGEVTRIEEQNRMLNTSSTELYKLFRDKGKRSCVLKGQGVAMLYPEPLRRQSGDIDLWVEGKRKETLRFLEENGYEIDSVVYHHADADILPGVEAEIHFLPCWTYNQIIEHRLQQYFREHAEEQFAHYDEKVGFAYPTLSFQAVQCLSHIYVHFLFEGVGMRQIIDCYYILSAMSDDERKNAMADIKHIGMQKFTSAVMYVLEKCCGMEAERLICQPEKKVGELLLDEIILTGNFGQYDTRYGEHVSDNIISETLRKYRRQIRFVRYYPLDVLTIPCWKLVHRMWRKLHGYL